MSLSSQVQPSKCGVSGPLLSFFSFWKDAKEAFFQFVGLKPFGRESFFGYGTISSAVAAILWSSLFRVPEILLVAATSFPYRRQHGLFSSSRFSPTLVIWQIEQSPIFSSLGLPRVFRHAAEFGMFSLSAWPVGAQGPPAFYSTGAFPLFSLFF